MEFKTKNTNTLAPLVYKAINGHGLLENSRNGAVRRIPEPVTIELTHPWERVCFSPLRDANPFFHVIEAMAMLAGENSVRLMAHFAKNMESFSDNGRDYNAFYGTRARVTWGDQLDAVIVELINNPTSRQAVVQLWDPADLTKKTKDKACNLELLFRVTPWHTVEMTTFNRSNDAVLGGVTGANIVHLSFFHEYVACGVGLPMGSWWHISNNLHAYVDHPKWQLMSAYNDHVDFYVDMRYQPAPLFLNRVVFDREVTTLILRATALHASHYEFPDGEFRTPFLAHTVVPIFNAWQAHKAGDRGTATLFAGRIAAPDWRYVALQWLERRYAKAK